MDSLFNKVFKNKYLEVKIWSFVKRYHIYSKRYDELNSVSFLLSIGTSKKSNNTNQILSTIKITRDDSFIELLKYKVKRGDLLKFESNEIIKIIQILSNENKIKEDTEFYKCLANNYKVQLMYIPNLLESICRYGNLIALMEFIEAGYKISKSGLDWSIEVGEFKIMKYLHGIGSTYSKKKILENIFLNHYGTKLCSVFLEYAINDIKIDLLKCNKVSICCYYYLQDDLKLLDYIYQYGCIEPPDISELFFMIPYPITNKPLELFNIINAFITILKRYIYIDDIQEEEEENGENYDFKLPPIPDFDLILKEIIYCKESLSEMELKEKDLYQFKKQDKRIECLMDWYISLFQPYGILSEGIELVYHYICKYFNMDNIKHIEILKKLLNKKTSLDESSLLFQLCLSYSNFDFLIYFFQISRLLHLKYDENLKIKKEMIFDRVENDEHVIIRFLTLYCNDENENNFQIQIANLIFSRLIQLGSLHILSIYFNLLSLKNSNSDKLLNLLEEIKNTLNPPLSSLSVLLLDDLITQIELPYHPITNRIKECVIKSEYDHLDTMGPLELCKHQRYQEMFEIIELQEIYKTIHFKSLYKEIGKRCVPTSELLERFINFLMETKFQLNDSVTLILFGLLKKSIQFGFLNNLKYLIDENANTIPLFDYPQIEKLVFYSIKKNDLVITGYLLEKLKQLTKNYCLPIESYLSKSENISTSTMNMFLKVSLPNLYLPIVIKKSLIKDLSIYYYDLNK